MVSAMETGVSLREVRGWFDARVIFNYDEGERGKGKLRRCARGDGGGVRGARYKRAEKGGGA